MLTDRQNRYYQEISNILSKEQISPQEKKYLLKAKKDLENGLNFKTTINYLCLSLEELSSLNSQVEILLKNLINVYGKPKYENNFETYQDAYYKGNFLNEKDWKESDSEYVYRGSGRYSGWTKRKNIVPAKRPFLEQLSPFLKSFILIVVVALFLFLPALTYLKQLFESNFEASLVLLLIIITFLTFYVVVKIVKHKK